MKSKKAFLPPYMNTFGSIFGLPNGTACVHQELLQLRTPFVPRVSEADSPTLVN